MVLTRGRVLVFAAAAGLILHFSVPPFHNPDEPQHFSIVVRKAWGDEKKEDIERGIIRMMDRARWWRTVGMGEPVELPRSFSEIRFISRSYKGDLKDLHRGFFLYHQAAAAVIGPVAGKSLERFYLFGRIFSYALFMAALLVIYGAVQAAAARGRKMQEAPLTFQEGAPLLFILFLPQVLIIALSVGPDPWCMLLGAVFFRSAFAVIRNDPGPAALLGLWGAALAGVLSDRSILVFVPLAVVSGVFAVNRKNLQRSILMILSFIAGIAAIVFAIVTVFPRYVESNVVFMKTMVVAGLKTFGSGIEGLFIGNLVESFFFRFGWMGFGAPGPVVWGWKMACLVAGVGVALHFLRKIFPGERRLGYSWQILAFSVVVLGLQVTQLRLATVYPKVMYAQGRYLFPMLLPIAVLFVAGFREFFDVIERVGSGVLRVARSILGKGAGRVRLSEDDAKGSRFPGGDVGRETRRPEDDDIGIGIETNGSRANVDFAGTARREGRKAFSEEKVWAAPGDALADPGPRPPRLGEWAVTAFLIIELLVLGYAVWALIIPAFHLTRATPIPGI